MSWGSIFESLFFWGPGALIAGLIIYTLYRLANNIGLEFIKAQNAQALALGRQAQSMEGLRDSIGAFVNRDSLDHREMIILLKVIAEKMNNLEERSCGRKEGKI